MLGITTGDWFGALALLAVAYCLGYVNCLAMKATENLRFYRYFDKGDWRVLGHCSCCPSRPVVPLDGLAVPAGADSREEGT